MARTSGYLVVLEEPLRDEDAERVLSAIRLIKGVVCVEPVEHSGSDGVITEMRVKTQLAHSLSAWLRKNLLGLDE